MSEIYIMDACALIAFLRNEQGAETVTSILKSTSEGTTEIFMNSVNLLEVFYDIYRSIGKTNAAERLAAIKKLPISIKSNLSDEVFNEAGRLKASYKISLADSIALAETSVWGGKLLTSDHHEFDIIEKQEDINFAWIR